MPYHTTSNNSGGVTSYTRTPGLGLTQTTAARVTTVDTITEEEISKRFGQAGLPTAPAGTHYMPNGSLMLGESHMDHTPDPNYKDVARNRAAGQSDYNKKRASTVAREVSFADIPIALRVHPQLWDVRPLYDLDAIKQSVKNLVITNFNERLFHPEIGSSVTGLLFEVADELTAIAVRSEIKRVIDEYEPRVYNVRVQVLDDPDANAYRCNIYFNVQNVDSDVEIDFYLERIR